MIPYNLYLCIHITAKKNVGVKDQLTIPEIKHKSGNLEKTKTNSENHSSSIMDFISTVTQIQNLFP